MLIAGAMFAFKAEDPKKEYCTVNSFGPNSGKVSIVTETDNTTEEIVSGKFKTTQGLMGVLNKLTSDGWKVVSFNIYGTYGENREYLLERTKQ